MSVSETTPLEEIGWSSMVRKLRNFALFIGTVITGYLIVLVILGLTVVSGDMIRDLWQRVLINVGSLYLFLAVCGGIIWYGDRFQMRELRRFEETYHFDQSVFQGVPNDRFSRLSDSLQGYLRSYLRRYREFILSISVVTVLFNLFLLGITMGPAGLNIYQFPNLKALLPEMFVGTLVCTILLTILLTYGCVFLVYSILAGTTILSIVQSTALARYSLTGDQIMRTASEMRGRLKRYVLILVIAQLIVFVSYYVVLLGAPNSLFTKFVSDLSSPMYALAIWLESLMMMGFTPSYYLLLGAAVSSLFAFIVPATCWIVLSGVISKASDVAADTVTKKFLKVDSKLPEFDLQTLELMDLAGDSINDTASILINRSILFMCAGTLLAGLFVGTILLFTSIRNLRVTYLFAQLLAGSWGPIGIVIFLFVFCAALALILALVDLVLSSVYRVASHADYLDPSLDEMQNSERFMRQMGTEHREIYSETILLGHAGELLQGETQAGEGYAWMMFKLLGLTFVVGYLVRYFIVTSLFVMNNMYGILDPIDASRSTLELTAPILVLLITVLIMVFYQLIRMHLRERQICPITQGYVNFYAFSIIDSAEGVLSQTEQPDDSEEYTAARVRASAVLDRMDVAGNHIKSQYKNEDNRLFVLLIFAFVVMVVLTPFSSMYIFWPLSFIANLGYYSLPTILNEYVLGALFVGIALGMGTCALIDRSLHRNYLRTIHELMHSFLTQPDLKGEGLLTKVFRIAQRTFSEILDIIVLVQIIFVLFAMLLFSQNLTFQNPSDFLSACVFPAQTLLCAYLLTTMLGCSSLKYSYEYRGALFDNVKKLFELGPGSTAEVAVERAKTCAVDCDLLGDPYKDVFGPSFVSVGLYTCFAVVWSQFVILAIVFGYAMLYEWSDFWSLNWLLIIWLIFLLLILVYAHSTELRGRVRQTYQRIVSVNQK